MNRNYVRCSVLSLWPPSLPQECDKMFLENKRWSPSNSHSSLLDQYWSAGKAAAAAGGFTLAFYHDDRGVWPVQTLKASQAAGSSIIHRAQTWSAMRYADVSIIWNNGLFFLLWLVEEAPDAACFLWVCWMCRQINMSAISTFYCSHMLQPDWRSGQFTASTTETKSPFNITLDLWMLLTSLIRGVYSASCLMGLCESAWTWFESEVLLSLTHLVPMTASYRAEVQQGTGFCPLFVSSFSVIVGVCDSYTIGFTLIV